MIVQIALGIVLAYAIISVLPILILFLGDVLSATAIAIDWKRAFKKLKIVLIAALAAGIVIFLINEFSIVTFLHAVFIISVWVVPIWFIMVLLDHEKKVEKKKLTPITFSLALVRALLIVLLMFAPIVISLVFEIYLTSS